MNASPHFDIGEMPHWATVRGETVVFREASVRGKRRRKEFVVPPPLIEFAICSSRSSSENRELTRPLGREEGNRLPLPPSLYAQAFRHRFERPP